MAWRSGQWPQLIEVQCNRLALVALIHMPLAAEIGLAPQVAARLQQAEQRALRSCQARDRHETRYRSGRWWPCGVEAGRVSVIEPGTDAGAPGTQALRGHAAHAVRRYRQRGQGP